MAPTLRGCCAAFFFVRGTCHAANQPIRDECFLQTSIQPRCFKPDHVSAFLAPKRFSSAPHRGSDEKRTRHLRDRPRALPARFAFDHGHSFHLLSITFESNYCLFGVSDVEVLPAEALCRSRDLEDLNGSREH